MKTNKIKYLLITGPKRSGKDTFFNLLDNMYPGKFRAYAYADQLKVDLAPLVRQQFGVDIFSMEGLEKESIRPLLISYGEIWRERDAFHWVRIVDQKIKKDSAAKDFCSVTTDNRYFNEILYFKQKFPDQCVVVSIRLKGGAEPTEAEAKSLPIIEPLIDYRIEWPRTQDSDQLKVYVKGFYEEYFSTVWLMVDFKKGWPIFQSPLNRGATLVYGVFKKGYGGDSRSIKGVVHESTKH